MKLENKHIYPYLAYKLQMLQNTDDWTEPIGDRIVTLCGVLDHGEYLSYQVDDNSTGNFQAHNFKMILRSLDDLTKPEILKLKAFWENEIMSTGDSWRIFWHYVNQWENKKQIPYWLFELLLEMHIDLFRLIEKGLAIDKNSLDKEQE